MSKALAFGLCTLALSAGTASAQGYGYGYGYDRQKNRPKLGLSSITDKQKEAAWRVEFDALGEEMVFQNVKRGTISNGAKRQAALRWLSEREGTVQPAWLAFLAAIAVAVISIIGLLVFH